MFTQRKDKGDTQPRGHRHRNTVILRCSADGEHHAHSTGHHGPSDPDAAEERTPVVWTTLLCPSSHPLLSESSAASTKRISETTTQRITLCKAHAFLQGCSETLRGLVAPGELRICFRPCHRLPRVRVKLHHLPLKQATMRG